MNCLELVSILVMFLSTSLTDIIPIIRRIYFKNHSIIFTIIKIHSHKQDVIKKQFNLRLDSKLSNEYDLILFPLLLKLHCNQTS
ncbi:hypothetical protein F4779DRAFT_577361 [Xylariaceae sp. FL0662B]|nr:hypothetical protein F4779DRAFT_577361 [Xylariaceae sp. FL0662B]